MKTIITILLLTIIGCTSKTDKDKEATSITEWIYLDNEPGDSLTAGKDSEVLYVYDSSKKNVIDTFYFYNQKWISKVHYCEVQRIEQEKKISFK